MRPIDKGLSPKVYTDYKKARHDLANVIGYFCSYCEMPVKNMIEVEHVHPQKNGGDITDWGNFLLSCKYCNTVKSNNNKSRLGYLWPDIDNTDLAFVYSEQNIIEVKLSLTHTQASCASNTISLMGLDRFPGGVNAPTEADTRWISRLEAWDMAKDSLLDWKAQPNSSMAKCIARTALGFGHYSIWLTVFDVVPEVCKEIVKAFKGTYTAIDENGNRIVRNNAVI